MVAAKAGTEKVDALWKQIQESLQRNMSLASSTLPTGASPTVRLMQLQTESPTAGSQHVLLDRLVLQVNEAIRALQRQGSEGKAAEIETARNLLADAHAAKQVSGTYQPIRHAEMTVFYLIPLVLQTVFMS